MKYAEPYILLLVPAVVITLIFFYLWAARRKKQLLDCLLGANADDPDSLHLSRTARLWKFILYLCSAVLILCGAARPYLKKIPVPLKNSGRDIVVIFDVSKSMRATDLPPSRMEQAKFLLRQIVKDSPGDRFALIAFAGNAFLSCPFTADHSAFNEYINDLDTDTVPLGGTNIERALLTAQRAFKGAEESGRAILMLTDGDALSGNAGRLISHFKKAGIPLIIAGLGDPETAAPVPDGKGGFIRGSDGKIAASCLNEKELSRLASETGGAYIRSTVGDTGAKAIEGALRKLTARERESGKSFLIDDKFPWFFAAGFILLLTAGFISEAPGSRNRTVPANRIVPLIICLGTAVALNAADAPGKAPEKLPQDALNLYNLARERQQNGDPSALRLYEEVIRKASGNSELQSRALHNFGVGCHLEGRSLFEKARQQLALQQPDAALKELESADSKLNNGKDFYTQVLSMNSSVTAPAGANLRQLELDKKQLEKLKKQIEELKKQQQKARQQTRNALNQQQNQQSQSQQQNQQKNQQQKQQQNQQQQIRQAAQSAAELEKQSADLKQEKLRRDASEARKELEKAAGKQEQNASQEEIKKHLEKAAELLGKPESDQKKDEKSGKAGKKDKSEKSDADKNASGAAAERRREEEKKAGENQLQMLNDESAKLRRDLRKRNQRGTPQTRVEKDW